MSREVDMPSLTADEPVFVCPESGLGLRALSVRDAESALGSRDLRTRTNIDPPPFGVTQTLMVRSDNRCAYPVVDGIPILLTPEQITTAELARAHDLGDVKYAEAYEEMTFYNEVAKRESETIRDSEAYQAVEPVLQLSPGTYADCPDPKSQWIDCVPDCKAQYAAYSYLAPFTGKRVVQLGGKGIHAVKMLLAGASESWLITPMLGEIYCGIALAREAGVLDRLRCVVGVAEEIPIGDGTFDAVYSGGCVHHMTTELAMPEIERVLNPGGRFAAMDPWRAPFYAIGTRLLGKREESVYCRPLTKDRVAPLFSTFHRSAKKQFGTLTRYLVIALSKFGIRLPFGVTWALYTLDDLVCSCIPGLRRLGSSVAMFATKGGEPNSDVSLGASVPATQ